MEEGDYSGGTEWDYEDVWSYVDEIAQLNREELAEKTRSKYFKLRQERRDYN